MVPSSAHDPGSGPEFGGPRGDAPGPFVAVGNAGEVHAAHEGDAGLQMQVSVDQARNRGPAIELDDLRRFSDPAFASIRIPHEHEPAAAHGKGFRHRLRGVARVDHPPADDEIGRASCGRPSTGGGERKRGKREGSATWNGHHGPYCGGQSGCPARRGSEAWRQAAVSRSVGGFRERRETGATRVSWR